MSKYEEIRARCDAATPGEWRTPPTFSGICSQSGDILAINRIVNTRDADMIFIAHAREDIPFLLNELAAKDEEIEQLQNTHVKIQYRDEELTISELCDRADKAFEQVNRLKSDCKQLKNLIEEAAEEIENCYGRETELSERLRTAL